jgi:arginyl-tRNA--protein-N-Asp/Glu arginylyltransferase
MNRLDNSPATELKFHITEPYSCSYLTDQLARSQVATPENLVNAGIYDTLIATGFRRSGAFTYRPCCDQCHACMPARISVNQFTPNRSQRRTLKRHQHLVATQHSLHFHPTHYALYQRYQRERHSNGSMENDNRKQYQDFLLQSNVNSRLIEFHDQGQLCMVSIIDKLANGLSSVYTFFDPDIPRASFGTYNILWQIEQCRSLNLSYVYLGYWIKENQKMSYKSNFHPLEILVKSQWRAFDSHSHKDTPQKKR